MYEIERDLPDTIGDLAALPDASDAICYEPAPEGGYRLSTEAHQAKVDIIEKLRNADERIALLTGKIQSTTIRRAVTTALTKAGCRQEVVAGAVAHLISAHPWEAVGDDPANLQVNVAGPHGRVSPEHFARQWLATEGNAFAAPVRVKGPLSEAMAQLRRDH